MHARRGTLPLLFLLSFAAVFIYSYHYHYHSSLRNPTVVPLQYNTNNPSPSFTFTIKLLAFDRIDSLRRCLLSLSSAEYGGDRVNLHVFLDHFRNGSDLVDQKLEESHRILDLLDEFDWAHGEKLLHYRTSNAGLQAQWLEAWWPVSDDDFAFVVEDDLEVSPLFYKFLKGLILKYYYDPLNSNPYIYGASLQRPRFVAGKHGNKLEVDSKTHLFLYQMVGTWGQLLFPKQWKEFRLWYDVHRAKGIQPILQGMVTTGWYKKMGDRIWTPWFIKFIHSRGYYNIYTNFLHERALSISHRDAGVNYGKTAGPDSKLLRELSPDLNLWELQPLRSLKWYDFCFREVIPWRVASNYDELGIVLGSLQKHKTITIVSLYRTTMSIVRNLLCHLERLPTQNFVFIGADLEFLHDLVHRGYPVIDSDKFIESIKNNKMVGLEVSETDLIMEIMVKANVIKRCLELGYDSWIIDGNMIPLVDLSIEIPNPSYSFAAANGVEMLFVKCSLTSLRIWVDNFILKVVAAGKSFISRNVASVENRHFVYFATKALNDAGAAGVWRFDELVPGVRLGANTTNQKSLENRQKFVFWSSGTTQDSVQRDLEKLDLWLIDQDFSCVAVVCH